VISHGALAASAGVFARALGTEQDDRTLILVPLFHNTGFVDQLSHSILAGSQVDLIAEFHVRDAIDALVRRPSSILMAVPSIFRLLMLDAHADEALRGCRAAVYGGAPMPPSWIDELKARWPAIDPVNCYGLTEFTSVSHMLLPPLSRERTDAVGMPVAGVRQTVRLESGAEAASGEVGELLVSGPMRMAGYHENETATAAAFDGDWLRTGDLVSAGDDGLVVLHGRASEVINRGGEKIHASQVAHAIAEWPGTDDVAVVGAPHEIFGEQVVAFVVASGGEGFDEDGLRSHLSERIADYAQPARVVLLDEIPRNAAGKPDQPQLRAAAATPESGRAG
jgi:acyl-CoA synthetase (AMP-forming)/AMP-acid ligase II